MKQILAIMTEGLERHLFTAAAARIVHQDKVIFEAAVGLLDPRKAESETKLDSLFDLASLTKPFVASGFMKLVESGQVGLDDFVSGVVPELADGEKSKITFRQLLSHTSGLPDSFNLYEKREWDKGREFVMRKLFNTPLIYTPGSKVVYSCLGYMLLGYAMEAIAGRSLDRVLDDVLFRPLSWSGLTFRPNSEHSDGIAMTTYSRPNRGSLPAGTVHDGNAIALGGISGNAGLFGTVRGVSKLGEILLKKEFFLPQSIAQMTSAQASFNGERRGLGWKLRSEYANCISAPLSADSFGHTGFTGTSLWVDPKAQLVMTLLTNSVHYYDQAYGPNEFNNFRSKFHQLALDLIL